MVAAKLVENASKGTMLLCCLTPCVITVINIHIAYDGVLCLYLHFFPLEENCKEVVSNRKPDVHRLGDGMCGLMGVQLWLKWADV